MKATDPDDPEQAEAMRQSFKRLLIEQAIQESMKGNGNMKNETKHVHSFSVDTSCDCGVMLSSYTRKLQRDNAALLEALKRLAAPMKPHDKYCKSHFLDKCDCANGQARAAIAATESDS